MNYVKLKKNLQLTQTKFLTIEHNKVTIKSLTKNIKKLNLIQNLFLKLNILKQQLRRYILLLRFIRKTLLIIIEKQSSRATKNKKQTRKKK